MKNLITKIKKLCKIQDLIQEGDKIAVGLSGGKDSLMLLKALCELRKKFKNCFSLIAICIDLSNGKMNFSNLKSFCEQLNVELLVINSNIFEIVFDIRKEKNPCSLCANLRRGVLNSIAIEQGCNKIALGHNLDDALETFLLNTFYTGNISTFAPKAYMDRSKITLIRPLIFTYEKDIKSFIKRNNIEIMEKCCPYDGITKREDMKNLINSLKKDIPKIKENLFGAILRSNIKGWEK